MSKLIRGTYGTIYDDGKGWDEVPCVVDITAMKVESFDAATRCRWFEDHGAMCTEEWVELADGRSFCAAKTDEYEDAVYGEYEDEFDRANTILYDFDALEKAFAPFKEEAMRESAAPYAFSTCRPAWPAGRGSSTKEARADVSDAVEHMLRAYSVMRRQAEKLEGYQEKWGEQYDYTTDIAYAREMMRRMEKLADKLEDMRDELKESRW